MQPIVLLIHLSTADAQTLRSSRDSSGAIKHISNGDEEQTLQDPQRSLVQVTAEDKLGTLVTAGDDDIFDNKLTIGKSFWVDIDPKCVAHQNPNNAESADFSLENNEEIKTHLSNDVSINASTGVASLSLSNEFSQSKLAVKHFIAEGTDYWRYQGIYSLQKIASCAYTVNPDLKADYDKLPAGTHPQLDGRYTGRNAKDIATLKEWRKFWNQYKEFFNKWGTHVVEEVYAGARVQLLSTLESDKQEDKATFNAKACADASDGAKALKGCNEFNKLDEKKVDNTKFEKSAIIAGGDPDISADLQGAFRRKGQLSPKTDIEKAALVTKFLKTADDQSVVKQTWEEIWNFTELTSGDNGKAIAKNMENYYFHLFKKMDERIFDSKKLTYCIENRGNFIKNKPRAVEDACMCGRSTVCLKGEVCNADACKIGNQLGCGKCSKPLIKIDCESDDLCERGQGDCAYDSECKGNLQCGASNCRTMRLHMGLPLSDYTRSEDCCFDPLIDDIEFGLKNHFKSLEETNSCADNKNVLKCMKEHEEIFGFGQYLYDENEKNTCAYWKAKDYCDNDSSDHYVYKKMLMDCCSSTCEFCATSH